MAVEDMLSDIRREAVEHTSAILADSAKGDYNTSTAVKDARFDINSRISDSNAGLTRQIDAIDDTLSAQLNTITRDTMDLRAQVTAVGYQVRDGFVAAAKDAEINALKTQIELAKQSTYLSDKIDAGNQQTQALIRQLNDDSLNRQLVERNTELVGALEGGRYWWGRHNDGQFNAVASQLQAFQSQLQETRQGMVNFGTMAGVGQSSTSNNVR